MCLANVRTRVKIATEDIPWLKVVNRGWHGSWYTPYKKASVNLGKTYHSELGPVRYKTIERGLHAFLTLEQAQYMISMGAYPPQAIVKCIIPKGSKYYIGQFFAGFKNTAITADTLIYGKRVICKES